MTDTQVYANIVSNIVALLLVLVSWRWRNIGRFLFVALFLWAAQLNMRLAIGNPSVYLDYARWAVKPYRVFILGAFARHAGLFVGTIAVGQLAIAILATLRGRAVLLGLGGAIAFLLAIAPLGRQGALACVDEFYHLAFPDCAVCGRCRADAYRTQGREARCEQATDGHRPLCADSGHHRVCRIGRLRRDPTLTAGDGVRSDVGRSPTEHPTRS